jgi:hypothetical protein
MNEKAPPLSAELERAATAGVADEGAMAMLTDNQRAVLQMLKTSRRGYSLPTVMARGFTFEMLQGLVSTGMAVAQRDAVGPSETKVPHLRITEAGRKAIAHRRGEIGDSDTTILGCGSIALLVGRRARIVTARLDTYRPSPCASGEGTDGAFPVLDPQGLF